MRPSVAAVVALAIALLSSTKLVIRSLGYCPPLLLSRCHFRVLEVGSNLSTTPLAQVTLSPQWLPPWRPALGEELLSSQMVVFDIDGQVLQCAADMTSRTGNAAAVYVTKTGMLWQWPTEHIGHERVLRVPPLRFDPHEPEGQNEAVWEPAARSMSPSDGGDADRLLLQTLSTSPPIFRIAHLLGDAVLDDLLAAASPNFERSPVTVSPRITPPGFAHADLYPPWRRVDDRRTSHSSWVHGYNDPRRSRSSARAVQRRVAAVLRLDSNRVRRAVEPLHAVEYSRGEYYEPHLDFFTTGHADTVPNKDAIFAPPNGSNRFATFIVYLTSVDNADDGGQTIFPFSMPSSASGGLQGVAFAGDHGAPSCAFPTIWQQQGLMVEPRRGDALLFYDQRPDGSLDERTRHGSCPVVRGTKRVINAWVWNQDVIYRR